MKQHTFFFLLWYLHRDFSLNITLHHNVIETWGWAYFTQATNQTLRIIVTLSNTRPWQTLEHPSN